MGSVCRFGRRFYENGFAGGCGGCTLFLAVFYLDRLDRSALDWSTRPRIKVWTAYETNKACQADRFSDDGDYGRAGVIDVAYGEQHPREARDKSVSDSEND